MNQIIRSMKPVLILGGLLLAMPIAAVAGKPDAGAKGGKPNENSVAVTAACTLPDNTAHVCSCKGLSNVVLWCGTTWVKHEDFGSGVDSDEVYEAIVGCVDSAGNTIPGDITMIGVKSGSQKNAKHHPNDYNADENAPSGSGLLVTPEACSSGFACPAPGDCSGITEPPGDDPNGGEPPADEDPPVPPILG